MSKRLTWTRISSYSGEEGKAGGLRLFGISYGIHRKAEMWSLSTTLPIKSPKLGQHYPTPTHAKVMAEQILAAFLARVDHPANPTPNGDPA